MKRYDGVNGQIAVDDPYVWITREELAADVRFPFPLDPRRAPLAKMLKCRYQLASDVDVGFYLSPLHLYRIWGINEQEQRAVRVNWRQLWTCLRRSGSN